MVIELFFLYDVIKSLKVKSIFSWATLQFYISFYIYNCLYSAHCNCFYISGAVLLYHQIFCGCQPTLCQQSFLYGHPPMPLEWQTLPIFSFLLSSLSQPDWLWCFHYVNANFYFLANFLGMPNSNPPCTDRGAATLNVSIMTF